METYRLRYVCYFGSVLNLFKDYTFNHKVELETGILKKDCESLLKIFFKELRESKKM